MMTRTVFILLISSLCTLSYCTPRTEPAQTEVLTPVDSISKDSAVIMETLPLHTGVPVGENERKIILIGVDPKGAVSMGDLAEL